VSLRSGAGDTALERITPNFACLSACDIAGIVVGDLFDTLRAAEAESCREDDVLAPVSGVRGVDINTAVEAATVPRLSTLFFDELRCLKLAFAAKLDGLEVFGGGLDIVSTARASLHLWTLVA
jgi:hypothetical protein